ncbi:MAG: NUDIX domain-containing protein [Bacteroidales bacterium]|nr:NUDIX domain-containing protein [Bacteroidales bacterium]
MDKLSLLKKMLPGLLPILIFIIADEIWGTTIGIYTAVGVGIIQLVFIGIKEGRLERFVLVDTALIIGMGGISLILHDDIFFKLKPAIIESILAVVLGISAFSSKNILMKMSERYMKDLVLHEKQILQMKQQVRELFYIVVLHIIMVIYSAYFLSNEAWAFVSTALFYIIFGLYFGFVFLRQYLNNRNTEWLPVVDKEGNVIGKATRDECHRNPELIYPVIRMHLINNSGQILLQKRSLKSDIEAGKWDAAVAGHIKHGEDIEQAVIRESQEEINFKPDFLDLLEKRIFKAPNSTALMFIFITQTDKNIEANKKEVEDARFFTFEQMMELKKEKTTSMGLNQEIEILRGILS